METTLQQTALHNWHVNHGGTMVDFAGWSMPVKYGSIIDEHHATRRAAGLFDVSHMGRFRFDGPDAERLLDLLVTRRVLGMKDGQIRYGLVTHDRGGILDDVLVYRLLDAKQHVYHLLVVNAGNRLKIWGWINEHAGDLTVELQDLTKSTVMIAAQGPAAINLLNPHLDQDLATLRYYRGATCHFDGKRIICSRTGYTGEDGCELIVPAEHATSVWSVLMGDGKDAGLKAAGLGARDTLRLEAAMPLYGHELNEQISPHEADLGFAVTLKDHHFIGRDAVIAARDDPMRAVRVGLRLGGKRPAREGCSIHWPHQNEPLGQVTSGTVSPTLGYPIAMGYVPRDNAQVGTTVEIDVRGRREPATVVELPFYKRP